MKRQRKKSKSKKPVDLPKSKLYDAILSIKSDIYRFTGLYLAHKEELDYIGSHTYWRQFVAIAKYERDGIGVRDIHGLLVGMWQVKHCLVRPSVLIRYKRPRFIFVPIAWFIALYLSIKRSLR